MREPNDRRRSRNYPDKRLNEDKQPAAGRDQGTLANWRFQKKGPPYLKVGLRVEYLHSASTLRTAQRPFPAEFGVTS